MNARVASVARREPRGLSRFFKAAHDTFFGGSNHLVYVTKRFIVLPLGADDHKNEEAIKQLQRDHGRHFLVWNLSDPDARRFNTKDLEDQVLDVTNFPDYVPTLQFTFETCNEIRYWLKQDPLNVAVVLYEESLNKNEAKLDPVRMQIASESRVAYLISAYLAYSGHTKSTQDGLDMFAALRELDAQNLIACPSQLLYYRSIDDIREGGFCNTEPLILDCIFVHTIPLLGGTTVCRPVLEITCNNRPIKLDERYTDIRNPKHPVFNAQDEIMVFESLGCAMWGDVVITCYQHTGGGHVKDEARKIDRREGKAPRRSPDKIPIFRICFHVGFLQSGGQMQRLKKADLDYACDTKRISRDLSVDLIFNKPAEEAKKKVPGLEEGEAGLEDFIFPSDYSGLSGISQKHVVEPRNEYRYLLSQYVKYVKKDARDSVMVWSLQRCNNRLDDAIDMLERIPTLQDELVKIEERLYVMGFPWKHGRRPANKGMSNATGTLRDEMFGKFLVWNLSGEDKFDYADFDNQVLSCEFTDHIPGIAYIVKLCHTMRYWLSVDSKHTVVILVNEIEDQASQRMMALTGKARAALVYSCFAALDDFLEDFRMFGSSTGNRRKNKSVIECLHDYAKIRPIDVDEMLSTPSILRLVNEFDVTLKSGLQTPSAITLVRVVIRTGEDQGVRRGSGKGRDTGTWRIPVFGQDAETDVMGCRPVLEVCSEGRLVYSSLNDSRKPKFLGTEDEEVMVFQLKGDGG